MRIELRACHIFYVDATAGDDSNSGLVPEAPWKTIAKVNAALLDPGERVLFKRGETWEERLTPTRSGSAGYPITYGAYGSGNKPCLDGTNISAANALLRLGAVSWLVFQDLEVKNCTDEAGIGCYGATDCQFLGVDSHNHYGQGAAHSSCSRMVYDGCSFYANTGIVGGSDGIAFSGGGYNIIRNCVAYGNGDDGFDIWSSPYCLVEYNDSYDNILGDANGFKCGAQTGGSSLIRFNRAWGNGASGFDTNGGENIDLMHNTARANNVNEETWGADFRNVNLGSIPNRYHNNISDGNDVNWDTGDYHSDHNTWDGTPIADPSFVSVVPGNPNYLRLNAGSACRNAGVDVGLPYLGSAPDMGAYEYIE